MLSTRSAVTGLELLDIVGRYAGIGVTTIVASWVGAPGDARQCLSSTAGRV
jgi:hypothetical protein